MTPFDWSMLFLFSGAAICIPLACTTFYFFVKFFRRDEDNTAFVFALATILLVAFVIGCGHLALERIDNERRNISVDVKP